MGEAVVEKLNELHELGVDVHWFCPRSAEDETATCFDEDVLQILAHESEVDRAARLRKVHEAEEKRNVVLECCKILAYDGSDAKPFQDQFIKGLKRQLTRCDVCVREYHRSRSLLTQNLEAQFDVEEVQLFMDKFDAMNATRIQEGLTSMTETLIDLPPAERKITSAGDSAMYALFEALNCVPFLKDEEALQRFFDRPFRLVQTNKKVKLPSYAPGMTSFLFSRSQERSNWAFRNFSQVKRPLAGREFECSVKPFLEVAIGRVSIQSLEQDFLSVFWRASSTIISKLTEGLVNNYLRAMDLNLYTTALEHFQIEGNHFPDLLSSYQVLLSLSVNAFWDAMGSISAQAVIETIFRAPNLQSMLRMTLETEPLHLEDKIAWTVQILKSLKPALLVPPTRTICDQLLHKFQTDEYSRYARSVSLEIGLECLNSTLRILFERVRGGPIVTHMIQIIASDHIQLVMQELDGIEKKNVETQIDKVEQLCLEIVENVLRLDIQGLTRDRQEIWRTKSLDHELGVSSLDIWKMSMRHVRPGNPVLASAILSGLSGLLALEDFTARQIQYAPRHAESWNRAHNRMLDYAYSDLLERLDGFNPEQLMDLMQDNKAAQGLIALLFNGEEKVHQAALNVLKVLSMEDSRRASLMHILSAFDDQTLTSVNAALDLISRAKVFGPCSPAVKLCSDMFSCLCDTADGRLRSSDKKFRSQTIRLLEKFWGRIWSFIGMVFEQTESWSSTGRDKTMMQDFCRETMDFADFAFDGFAHFATTLQEATPNDAETIRRLLLSFPKEKFGYMIKWLRLRDDYLVSKAVGLTIKMLGRLQEIDIKIDTDAAQFIENVATGSEQNAKVKTKLSWGQKAELRRALENHLGEDVKETIDVDAQNEVQKRRVKQMDLQQWAGGASSSGTSTSTAAAIQSGQKVGTIDMSSWSDAAKRRKEIQDREAIETKKLLDSMGGQGAFRQKMPTSQRPFVGKANDKLTQKKEVDSKNFLLKRQKEREEAEKRKAAILAKEKGAGIGSGVAGLGDIGKDYTLKGQNVMMSSDEESEDSDDDELDADLFGAAPKDKRKIERPNVDPNGAVGLRPEQKMGPTKIQRTQRSVKDMRARLAPDLSSLHKVILSWDFFHEGDYPPGMAEHQFRQVSNTFTDPTTYQQTFEPLLTLEAWQGMAKAREENMNKPYEVRIQNRTNVDSFIEITSLISHQENREVQLQEGDILLFSKAKHKPLEDATAPHCLARVYRVKRQKAHCEVVYQLMPGSSLVPSLAGKTTVCGVKVQSITPLEREYGALQGLQYYDLCMQVLRAKPSRRGQYTEKQIQIAQDVWNVNRAQAEAINAAMENEGFSLIQGPPGSGKTKTITAIVGGLLTQALSVGTREGAKISLPKPHGNINTNADAPPRKLLVCAPSNAAVDELVIRMKEGVKTKTGRHHMLNVVRIGRSDAINQQVMDVTMDALVAKRLGGDDNAAKMRERNAGVFKEHEQVSNNLRELREKKDNGSTQAKDLAELESSIGTLSKRKRELGVKIDNLKDAERNAGREAELNRKRAQQAILDEAHVICATLSGSGHDMFQALNIEFETVIIDEAAQCVEMSSLIPLKYGCVKCIMVGDPKQLPPTVFSREAAKFQYEQSLFVRMQNNHSQEVYLLDTQYRMHPDISTFPSRTFYDGLLKDGDGMAGLRARPWHKSGLLAPYRFFDVKGQHQNAPRGHSLVNYAEIDIAMALFERLTTDFASYDYSSAIGVITPYKSQLRALKDRFVARFGSEVTGVIEFNTTDAFQGRESEIIIFSCVRASPAGGIGFLQDIRRMNVGLTRAKSSLWVLGNSESLSRGQWWKKLVDNAQARDLYTTGDVISLLKRPSTQFPADTARTRAMLDIDAHVPQMDGSSTSGGQRSGVNGSSTRQHLDQANSRPSSVSRSNTSTPQPRVEPTTEKMEGVRYRAEDRLGLHRQIHQRGSSMNPSSGRSTPSLRDTDVDMEDASNHTPEGERNRASVSRSGTPVTSVPDVEREDGKVGGSTVNLHPGRQHRAEPPVQVKKRPAPNPFMPRKQNRR